MTPPPPIHIITDHLTMTRIRVPVDVVSHCESFTMLDAHAENNDYDSLRLYDCFLYKMGYYGDTPQQQKKSAGSADFRTSMDDDGRDRTSHTFVF